MEPDRLLVFGVAIPAALAAAVLLERKLTKRGDDAGFALAAGFAAGYVGLGERWRFPPVESTDALLPMALLVALLLMFGVAKSAVPLPLRSTVHVVLAGVAVWFTLVDRNALAFGGAMASVVAFLWTMETRAEATGPKSFLATTLVTCAATAVAIGVSGTMRIGGLAAALAAATGGATAYSLKWPVSTRGAALSAGILLPMLWLGAWIFADLPLASMVLLAAAPIASHVALQLAKKRAASPAATFAAELGVSLALCGAAASIAISRFEPSPY